MLLEDKRNKDKTAIVVVGYNRLNSIKRLLGSLIRAQYSSVDVPLYISIDASGDAELYEYVNSFEWPYGDKYTNIQEERLGLRKHIIQCGNLTKFFKAIILLEDDIFVSENFYQYTTHAVSYYYDDDRIGGISLYQHEVWHKNVPIVYMNDGSDTYLKQTVSSWGQCWTDKQWNGFQQWYNSFQDDRFSDIDMPENFKQWKKAWSKYYMAYLIETNRYFVFPNISRTTCFGDAGEHSSIGSTIGQVNLICGESQYHFKPFNEMVKYDIYGTNESIYSWLGLSKEELCVDWYCNDINRRKCRYILTTAKMPAKIVRSFGLLMRPIELNVKYHIEGDGIYLYDTNDGRMNSLQYGFPKSISYYYLRGYDFRLAGKYAVSSFLSKLKNKLKKALR